MSELRRLYYCDNCICPHNTIKCCVKRCIRKLMTVFFIIILCTCTASIFTQLFSTHDSPDYSELKGLRIEIEKLKNTANGISSEKSCRLAARKYGDGNTEGACMRNCMQEQAGLLKKMIKDELSTYDADKTGMTDFAMKRLGGKIISTCNTENYGDVPLHVTAVKFLTKKTDFPEASAILEPSVVPGDCWAFIGKRGVAIIQLFAIIRVTNVTLEHIPRAVSASGDISSAPRYFSVTGLEEPEQIDGHNFGTFSYDRNGPTVQTFTVHYPSPKTFQIVRVDFQDNHGNNEFTCVYRVRIHGERFNDCPKK